MVMKALHISHILFLFSVTVSTIRLIALNLTCIYFLFHPIIYAQCQLLLLVFSIGYLRDKPIRSCTYSILEILMETIEEESQRIEKTS